MGFDLTGLGSIADFAKGIIDRFFPPSLSPAEKAQKALELQQMLQARESALLETQKSVIVAEMQQGDAFTKRARPAIVYAGLFFIFLVHVFLPIVAFFTDKAMPTLSLPSQFWWAWSGVCGIWIMGRTAEKAKATGRIGDIAKLITGGR